MKVLHVLDHSLPVQDGYAFRTREILRFTGARGVETAHVTSSKHGAAGSASEPVDGVLYHRTEPRADWLSRLPLMNQWAVVTSLRARLRELIARERPHLLHVHSPALNGLAALGAARDQAVPVLYEMRSLWEDAAVDKGACKEGDLRYRASRALESHVLRRSDAIVCICEGLRGDVLGRGVPESRVTVIPNAVDVERFAGARVPPREVEDLAGELGLTAGSTLGFIGSFFAFEGLGVLIEAMPAIVAARPEARLLLVGGGPEEERLAQRVEALGLGEHVVFTGRVPHGEVERYYALVDVFVYPRVSMRITELVTPLKPLEAMASRKLVLASDVGGHREMVRDGVTGTLFAAGAPEDLAGKCLALLADPGRWPSLLDAGRGYVERERSWSRNAESYLAVYGSLLGEVRPDPRGARGEPAPWG